MEVIYSHCCGLDIQAKTVVACLNAQGQKQIRTFTTMTNGLLQLSDWLAAAGCTHVVIESTGFIGVRSSTFSRAALKYF